MPQYETKMIYVKKEDSELYEEASKMGDSLSSVVAAALREYMTKDRRRNERRPQRKEA